MRLLKVHKAKYRIGTGSGLKLKSGLLFFKELLLWLISLVVLVPLFLVVINSFKNQTESDSMNLLLPGQFQFANYLTVIDKGNIPRAFLNSLIITLGSVFLTNLASAMGAYVLARRRSKLNKVIYFYFVLGLIAPINMIPTIKIMQTLNIINTYQGIIFLYSALLIPFTIFLFYGFINTIPKELDEAAVLDGCNSWQLFFRVVFPLLTPVTVTVTLVNFVNAWNDFILPLYVFNKSEFNPMTLAVYNFYGTYISSWNLVCTSIVLTTLPIIVIYLVGQRYIVSGMTAGAVKG